MYSDSRNSLREFIKQISIYGVLPVIGKFIGFFLVPIYARVFSSSEFGMVELILTLVQFLVFASGLEFYTAIGRYFHSREAIIDKRKLISTGLFLTIFFTLIVICLGVVFQDKILNIYLKDTNFRKEYLVALLWLFFSSIFTYLGVIPRYDNRPKLYVIINITGLIVRVVATIFFVLELKIGIIGVIYGNIVGAVTSTILNIYASWKYLIFSFSMIEAKQIMKFAFPIVPGLILVGLWSPLSRNLVSEYFSIAVLGLLAFALRITSVMEMVNSAIRLAWNPMLFENYNKSTFKNDVSRISRFTGIITFFAGIVLTMIGPEIAYYIGTPEYAASSVLIGFLTFKSSVEILSSLRGFGPLVFNKTYILTLNEILGMLVGIFFFWLFQNRLGLIGLGLIFLLPGIFKYLAIVIYTSKKININFHSFTEFWIVILFIVSIVLVANSVSIQIRYTFLLFTIISIGVMLKRLKMQKEGLA